MKLFLNISNHPVGNWEKEQLQAMARLLDTQEWKTMDIPFPVVNPSWDAGKVAEEGNWIVEMISFYKKGGYEPVVHIMGEMGLTVYVVSRLLKEGIRCFHSTTERIVEEGPDGKKISTFRFGRFREYIIGETNEETKH